MYTCSCWHPLSFMILKIIILPHLTAYLNPSPTLVILIRIDHSNVVSEGSFPNIYLVTRLVEQQNSMSGWLKKNDWYLLLH